ncbi:MAG TPA: acylphosphatase [Burkholderiales bacterium]|jgi:acylphosphatase|nr:acylphosphatase [Burkholderiales bacterium]
MISRRLRIRGLVQGVFYRESMRQQAAGLKVAGWVRNRADGSVEAVLQGEVAAIERLIDWAREGPPAARVEVVEVEAADEEHALVTFEKRPTL